MRLKKGTDIPGLHKVQFTTDLHTGMCPGQQQNTKTPTPQSRRKARQRWLQPTRMYQVFLKNY
jgi:hypothetical protein